MLKLVAVAYSFNNIKKLSSCTVKKLLTLFVYTTESIEKHLVHNSTLGKPIKPYKLMHP